MAFTKRRIITGKRVYFDVETTGLNPWQGDQPFSVQFANPEGDTVYLEWPVDPYTRAVDYTGPEGQRQLEQVAEVLEDPTVVKVGHNVKFDVRMMEVACGVRTAGRIEDTMFMAHACNTLEPTYALKPLAKYKVGFPDDDQTFLQRAVTRLRREAQKVGWQVAWDWKVKWDGSLEKDGAVAADYWLPSAFKRWRPWTLTPEEVAANEEYGVNDVLRCGVLDVYYQKLIQQRNVRDTYERELALWPVTYAMETRGVRCSRELVVREMDKSVAQMKEHGVIVMAEADRHEWATPFNMESHVHLAKLFYGHMGLKCGKHTDNWKVRCPYCGGRGSPQTSFASLKPHLGIPSVLSLFKHKTAHKGYSSFFRKYYDGMTPDPLNPGGMCLRPDFNQVGPATGRFSCRNPNLQNVASALTTRATQPVQARTPFGPRPGYRWYHVDYSQLEVRVFADVAQEPTLLAALASGRDLHTECTNKAWGPGGRANGAAVRAAIHALGLDGLGETKSEGVVAFYKEYGVTHKSSPAKIRDAAEAWLDQFDYDIVAAEGSLGKKNSRAKAKMVLFLKVFGGGPDALADLLECSVADAAQFLADYDAGFPRIVEYLSEMTDVARSQGYIVNRYGRRITVDRDSPYKAVNYMVQGSAADLMKTSMIRVHALLQETGLDAHMVMTIHDELVFEVRKAHAYKWLLRKICDTMADHQGHFNVPTPVEMDKAVNSWDTKVKVEL